MDIPSTVLIWKSNSYFYSCSSCQPIPPFLDLTHCLGLLLLFRCSLIFRPPFLHTPLHFNIPRASICSPHFISCHFRSHYYSWFNTKPKSVLHHQNVYLQIRITYPLAPIYQPGVYTVSSLCSIPTERG